MSRLLHNELSVLGGGRSWSTLRKCVIILGDEHNITYSSCVVIRDRATVVSEEQYWISNCEKRYKK